MIRNKFSRVSVALDFSASKNRTKQEFKDECDINQILAKYVKTGVITHSAKFGGQYMDCPAFDFREAMEKVAQAEMMFIELPAKVRERFRNDPGQFLQFVQDPKNAEEAAALGLATPPPATTSSPAAPPASRG